MTFAGADRESKHVADGLPGRLLDRPAPEAVRWLALARLQELIAARHRLDDPGDAKALHDFRVALRRFQSLVRTYQDLLDDSVTRKSRRRLRRLASSAGLSRDCEVRLNWLRQHVKNSSTTADGIAWVEAELERDRIKGDRQLQRAVERNFTPLVDRLQRTVRRFRITTTLGEVTVVSPMRDIAARALDALVAAVEDALAQARAAGNPELMHRVRIAAKRLRHALEPLVDGKLAPARTLQTARAAIAQLKRIQDALGDLHDELAFDQWLAGRDLGELALARTHAAVVERVRRQLHRKIAAKYRTLDGPLWRHRIDGIIRRAHTVADHLLHRRSATPDALSETDSPTPGAPGAPSAGLR